jgi:Na+/melibiose symporter-like transporter
MLDVRLFGDPRFGVASGGLGLATFALFGVLFFATQHLQGVLGYDPLEAGLRVLPVAAGMLVAAPLSHVVVARLGIRVTVAAGFALVAAGCVLFLRADVDTGYGVVWPAMLVAAIGMGLAMPPATDSVMGAVGVAKAGVGSAMNDTSRLVGGALGVAVVGSVLSTGYRGGMDDAPQAAQDSLGAALGLGDPALRAQAADAFVGGMHSATLVAAAVAAVAAVLAATLLPRRVATPALGEVAAA